MKTIIIIILIALSCLVARNAFSQVNIELSAEWRTLPYASPFAEPTDSVPFLMITYTNLSDEDLFFQHPVLTNHMDFPYIRSDLGLTNISPLMSYYMIAQNVKNCYEDKTLSVRIYDGKLEAVEVDELGQRTGNTLSSGAMESVYVFLNRVTYRPDPYYEKDFHSYLWEDDDFSDENICLFEKYNDTDMATITSEQGIKAFFLILKYRQNLVFLPAKTSVTKCMNLVGFWHVKGKYTFDFSTRDDIPCHETHVELPARIIDHKRYDGPFHSNQITIAF